MVSPALKTDPEQPAKNAAIKPLPKSLEEPPKTTGEKWFNGLRFAIGEVGVLGLTALIATESRYGRDTWAGGIPNIFKKMQAGFEKLLKPLADKGGDKAVIAGALASTMVTFHGGNVYIPVYKGIQDNKENIVTYFNKTHGKPGEVEAGRERLRHQTKENWGDVVKGRLAAFAIVFTSFLSADLIAGKDAKGARRFDTFSEKFGEKISLLTKEGKNVAAIADTTLRKEALEASKSYRFGKILALDIYATTAAIALWTTISKLSAIVRGKKSREAAQEREGFIEGQQAVIPNLDFAPEATEAKSKPSFAARVGEPAQDYRKLAQQPAGDNTLAMR